MENAYGKGFWKGACTEAEKCVNAVEMDSREILKV
jgi:hypothetical protein